MKLALTRGLGANESIFGLIQCLFSSLVDLNDSGMNVNVIFSALPDLFRNPFCAVCGTLSVWRVQCAIQCLFNLHCIIHSVTWMDGLCGAEELTSKTVFSTWFVKRKKKGIVLPIFVPIYFFYLGDKSN